MRSFVLTAIQYILLGWILYSNDWLVNNKYLKILQFVGLALGIWAIFVMRNSNLNITPSIRKGTKLITNGPYHFIRHPMYLSLLLVFLPMLTENYGTINLVVFGIFVVNLILKLEYEEQLLKEEFEAFADYSKRSWKLFPFVY